jgi:hypothetical protein
MSSGSGPNPSRYPGWGPAAVSRSDWPGPGPGAAECRTRRPVASVSCPACAVSRDQRQEQGPRPGTAPSPPRHLQPQRRRPAPVRRLRPDPRPAVRARQDPQEAHPVPGVLPLPAQPVSAGRAHRDRLRQLLPAPVHQRRPARRRLGRGQQRGGRLHPDELLVAQPHRTLAGGDVASVRGQLPLAPARPRSGVPSTPGGPSNPHSVCWPPALSLLRPVR